MPDIKPPSSEAADPSPYEEAARRSSSTSRYAAHGRGGAGNVSAAPPPPVAPSDLETPTLKEETAKTGLRGYGACWTGGAANIVKVPTRTGEEERSVEGKEGSEKGGLREEKEVKGKGKKNEGTPEEGV
ncbi:hypothetical protein ACLOAV_009253 [Pseudogymnoascus australis]